MTSRHIQDSNGRFAGSIGAGKTTLPTASDLPATGTPAAPAHPPGQETFRSARIARAATRGRQLVFGPNVKACHRQIDPAKPFIAVTYVLTHGTDADRLAQRLRAAGTPVRRASGYTRAGSDPDAWVIEEHPSGDVEVISPLMTNSPEGWASARTVERKIRGNLWSPGAHIGIVETEAGTPENR